MQAIVTHFEVDYLKKGRGDLIAEAKSEFVGIEEEKKCQIEAIIRDAQDNIVARGKATWLIRPTKL
jgi:low affinity Fe/Cu permease